MSTDWLPRRDLDLRRFSANAVERIAPDPMVWGLSESDSASLSAASAAFSAALQVAGDPLTRTRCHVEGKRVARAALETNLRSVVGRVRHCPAVSDEMCLELGLRPHDGVLTPAAPPRSQPMLGIVAIARLRQRLHIADLENTARRARPADAIGAEVYAYVGEEPAPMDDLSRWRFVGLATRKELWIDYPADAAGRPVTLLARWINRKGQGGPVSNPVQGRVAA